MKAYTRVVPLCCAFLFNELLINKIIKKIANGDFMFVTSLIFYVRPASFTNKLQMMILCALLV